MLDSTTGPNPSPSDIFIPILGVTGVGKSTFINVAAGKVVVPENQNLDSEAGPIKTVIVTHPRDPTCRITFVDTPGFNDTFISDAEVLRRIVEWLDISCNKGMKLRGIVYLHDITQSRLHETYAERFKAHNAVLATTKWNQPERDVEQKHEEELSRMKGLNMRRFLRTRESAWDIINLILQNPPPQTASFQEALRGLQKHRNPQPRSKKKIFARLKFW